MSPLLIILILILVFGLGGGYYMYPHYGMLGGVGPFGGILVLILILYLLGVF